MTLRADIRRGVFAGRPRVEDRNRSGRLFICAFSASPVAGPPPACPAFLLIFLSLSSSKSSQLSTPPVTFPAQGRQSSCGYRGGEQ